MNNILSSLGLGGSGSLNTTPYLSNMGSANLTNDLGTNPAGAAASSPTLTNNSGTSWATGLLNFGNGVLKFGASALPVAAGINNLVNQPSGQKASNNTSAQTGVLAKAPSISPWVWIGALVGGGLLLFAVWER